MNEQPERFDFMTWFRSLPDTRQEVVLLRARDIAEAILAKHAQDALQATPPKVNVYSAN